MKFLFDLFPVILFFVAFKLAEGNPEGAAALATGCGGSTGTGVTSATASGGVSTLGSTWGVASTTGSAGVSTTSGPTGVC